MTGSILSSLLVNQFGATKGSWMGLSSGDLAGVFPDLANFGNDWQAQLDVFT